MPCDLCATLSPHWLEANSRRVSVFVFGLDLDSENVGEVTKNNLNGNSGNEADTWTLSAPQAIEHGMNYLRENVHARAVEGSDRKMASEAISEHQVLKTFWGGGGIPPDTPSCSVIVVNVPPVS